MGFPIVFQFGLDSTYLKSKYQVILLTATSVDANGSLFPLTYLVFTLSLPLLHVFLAFQPAVHPLHIVQLLLALFPPFV